VNGRTRLLGIDYGRVRLGLAVSDPARRIASPLATYERRDPEQDARYLRQVIEKEEIGRIVLGLPVHLDGRESPMATEVRKFAKWLTEVTGVACVFWDERFTSVEAEAALWSAGLTHRRRKDRRDRVAAQILLQAYLEAGPEGCNPGPLQT
jgi:putative Holliday junction resolvase